ncbi:hypothetical protein [Brevibacillus sp. Leaf182]|uniref:hypothetical protein n=1 Tax=Brevibacillus sp. Leaf182 TaxID=1736290 RepID=UPI0006F67EC2|nr:hypothetical protein [Brevibacillus sp. Leaf182]RAT98712.1 hypothetical protein ASG16_003280 [Brevibacillus sp. Leaf182]
MSIKANRLLFEKLATHAFSPLDKSNLNKVVISANLAATSAWLAFPGFYCHRQLERVLLNVSEILPVSCLSHQYGIPSSIDDGRRVLHVLSTAYDVGGHTRLVERWINNRLQNERHAVVLTNQTELGFENAIPSWLLQAVNKAGGECISISDSYSVIEKAQVLRSLAYEWADIVVLHTHPNDSIPLIAFGVPDGPPIILLNHADHVFWMGSSISDSVIDVRKPANVLTKGRRFVRQTHLLPLPLDGAPEQSKKISREKIGIDNDKVVLLSIATPEKYEPIGEYSFIKSSTEILKRNLNSILIVVGPDSNNALWQKAIEETNGRILLTGLQRDVTQFYSIADIYLESFPFGSFTAALDACLFGIPVVKAPKPLSPLLTVERYNGMSDNAINFESYIDQVENYIINRALREIDGEKQKKDVTDNHVGSGWKNKLQQVIQSVPDRHEVKFGENSHVDKFVHEYDLILMEMLKQQRRHVQMSRFLGYYLPKLLC